jgi:hypothetical protein
MTENNNVKYNHWVNEIDKDKLYLDQFKDQFTGWEINRLMEYIDQEIGRELKDINHVLTANPGMEITFAGYEKLKKVKTIIEAWKLKQAPAAADQAPKPDNTFISHLVIDENKKQPFADELKSNFKDLTGKDLAIMFYAAQKYINLKNRKALHETWQQFIGHEKKRDEAMSKAMRTLKSNEKYYAKELKDKTEKILNIYQSIK